MSTQVAHVAHIDRPSSVASSSCGEKQEAEAAQELLGESAAACKPLHQASLHTHKPGGQHAGTDKEPHADSPPGPEQLKRIIKGPDTSDTPESPRRAVQDGGIPGSNAHDAEGKPSRAAHAEGEDSDEDGAAACLLGLWEASHPPGAEADAADSGHEESEDEWDGRGNGAAGGKGGDPATTSAPRTKRILHAKFRLAVPRQFVERNFGELHAAWRARHAANRCTRFAVCWILDRGDRAAPLLSR